MHRVLNNGWTGSRAAFQMLKKKGEKCSMIKSCLKHLFLEETEFWNVTDTQPAFLTFQP